MYKYDCGCNEVVDEFPCVEKLCTGNCPGREEPREQRLRQRCSKCRPNNINC